MPDRAPFPLLIDNTSRSDFVSCPRKFYIGRVLNLHPSAKSIHLHAGGAYATGLETLRRAYYVEDRPLPEALAEGISDLIRAYGNFDPGTSPKTLWNMVAALAFYCERWPLATDYIKPAKLGNQYGIEYSDAIPLEDCIHPTSGMPILYGGRCDMIGAYHGQLFIEDDKTTTSLGQRWLSQWELASGITGYVWMTQMRGYKVQGAILRGVSILARHNEGAESIQYRKSWELERWRTQLSRDIKRMIQCWNEDYWDFNLDHSCNDFGGCPYRKVCTSPRPEKWLATLKESHWSPITLEEPAT